jgi:hypothetical protein
VPRGGPWRYAVQVKGIRGLAFGMGDHHSSVPESRGAKLGTNEGLLPVCFSRIELKEKVRSFIDSRLVLVAGRTGLGISPVSRAAASGEMNESPGWRSQRRRAQRGVSGPRGEGSGAGQPQMVVLGSRRGAAPPEWKNPERRLRVSE